MCNHRAPHYLTVATFAIVFICICGFVQQMDNVLASDVIQLTMGKSRVSFANLLIHSKHSCSLLTNFPFNHIPEFHAGHPGYETDDVVNAIPLWNMQSKLDSNLNEHNPYRTKSCLTDKF